MTASAALIVVITGLGPVIHVFFAGAGWRGWPGLGPAMTIFEGITTGGDPGDIIP
jgi:hypothetical protein